MKSIFKSYLSFKERSFLLGMILLSFLLSSFSLAKDPSSSMALKGLDQYPPQTALSKKGLNLKVGMTKKEVLELLGPPTWGDKTKYISLIWVWDNEICNPINVIFNNEMHVIGFDQGRAKCLTKKFPFLPSDRFLCTNTEQMELCK